MDRVGSGNKDLDLILGGGFPSPAVTLIGGGTGTGKTTLAHQILYANLKPGMQAVYVTVLGNPVHKIIRSMQPYEFFSADILLKCLVYEDLGDLLAREGFRKILDYVFYSIHQSSPDFVCLEGVHRFRSISPSQSEYFSFTHELAGLLSALRCVSLWTGMYTEEEAGFCPEAAVADHVVHLSAAASGARSLKLLKLSGSACVPAPHAYSISPRGLRLESAEAGRRPG